jgi:hypothetical protein
MGHSQKRAKLRQTIPFSFGSLSPLSNIRLAAVAFRHLKVSENIIEVFQGLRFGT